MDLHCIHSPDIFFTGGNILCKTPQKKRGLDDYVFMYICMLYVYICSLCIYACCMYIYVVLICMYVSLRVCMYIYVCVCVYVL